MIQQTAPGAPLIRDAASLLSRASIFASLSREDLESIAGASEFLDYEHGSPVFEADDPGDRLWVVAEGSVEIRSPADGSVLAEFVEGDSFGELELLTRSRRDARASASGPCRLLAFPAAATSLEALLSSNPALAARILRSFLIVVAGRTRKANALVKENSPWVRELRRQVYGDKLTGLLNKAWLEENLPGMLAGPLALLMLKPDNFKELNDGFGHEAGDAALVLMAHELARSLPPGATAVRYMGNELALVLPGADRPAALAAAKAVQAGLSSLDLSGLCGGSGFHFTISLGIALYPEAGKDAPALIAAAEGLPLAARSRGGSLILFPEDLA